MFYLFINERQRERKRERGRDTGRGKSRLHAGSLTERERDTERETEREKGRDTGRGRSRLQAGSPMRNSILGPQDHALAKGGAKSLSHPGCPLLLFLCFNDPVFLHQVAIGI